MILSMQAFQCNTHTQTQTHLFLKGGEIVFLEILNFSYLKAGKKT